MLCFMYMLRTSVVLPGEPPVPDSVMPVLPWARQQLVRRKRQAQRPRAHARGSPGPDQSSITGQTMHFQVDQSIRLETGSVVASAQHYTGRAVARQGCYALHFWLSEIFAHVRRRRVGQITDDATFHSKTNLFRIACTRGCTFKSSLSCALLSRARSQLVSLRTAMRRQPNCLRRLKAQTARLEGVLVVN
jgi:hypothetical protein